MAYFQFYRTRFLSIAALYRHELAKKQLIQRQGSKSQRSLRTLAAPPDEALIPPFPKQVAVFSARRDLRGRGIFHKTCAGVFPRWRDKILGVPPSRSKLNLKRAGCAHSAEITQERFIFALLIC